MKKYLACSILLLTGIILSSCSSAPDRLESSQDNLADHSLVDPDRAFIFGRLVNTFSYPLGIYMTNLDTSAEMYIPFNQIPADYEEPRFPNTQEGIRQKLEYQQKKNISVFSLPPGRYKITHFQNNKQKTKTDGTIPDSIFTLNTGEIMYIGDWTGNSSGNLTGIAGLYNRFEYTSGGLLMRNESYSALIFRSMFD